MAEPDLTLLGEIIVRVQDDMRDLRARVAALETNLLRLEGDMVKGMRRLDGRLDGIDGRLDGMDGRLDGIDGRLYRVESRLDGLDAKLDRLDASWEARFRQLTQTMTTNFAVVIEALK